MCYNLKHMTFMTSDDGIIRQNIRLKVAEEYNSVMLK